MGGVMEGQSNDEEEVLGHDEDGTSNVNVMAGVGTVPGNPKAVDMSDQVNLDENSNRTGVVLDKVTAKNLSEGKNDVQAPIKAPDKGPDLTEADRGKDGDSKVVDSVQAESTISLKAPQESRSEGDNQEEQGHNNKSETGNSERLAKPDRTDSGATAQGQENDQNASQISAGIHDERHCNPLNDQGDNSEDSSSSKSSQKRAPSGPDDPVPLNICSSTRGGRETTNDDSSAPLVPGEVRVSWQWTDQMTLQEYRGTRAVLSAEELLRQRQRLPIHQFREQLLNAVRFNQVVVVVGETASGKSTQMPQYLLDAGLVSGSGESGRIAITQPRRVAAVSLASRVAQERGCVVGDLVGYSIRFEDMSGPRTVIKYMTDGLLVMECLRDPTFATYGCVILDEAHERTLHTDILLGLLKKAIRMRPELKVIITSATLDIKKFADYFGAPMLKIPGKNFPVTLKYLSSKTFNNNNNGFDGNNNGGNHADRGGGCFRGPLWTRAKRTDAYLGMAVERVVSIHTAELGKPGDILLFLPGKEEVEGACEKLHRKAPDLMPLPVYAALPFEAQCGIFNSAPPGVRKVIVATNIAETSITIDGVRFVIDTGLFKECIYDRGIDTLRVTVISKAQAHQRAGRAGRTAPGICHRLYTCEDYERMKEVPSPAIHRADFTSTALQLKAMGIDDICGFGFMDQPRRGRVNQALHRLGVIGALDRFGKVTPLGFKMAEFPLLPNLSKILLTAAEMSCSDEVLTIVSMLSAKYVFLRPRKRTAEADTAKAKFLDPMGDHLTLLNVYNAWKASGMSEAWSRANFVHQKEMERASEIRGQLQALMTLHEVPVVSAGRYLSNIRKALSTGEPNNVACRDHWYRDGSRGSGSAYRTYIDHQLVFVHPSSALYRTDLDPEFVIYHETITTTRNFMRTVSVCEPSWLPKLLNPRYA